MEYLIADLFYTKKKLYVAVLDFNVECYDLW